MNIDISKVAKKDSKWRPFVQESSLERRMAVFRAHAAVKSETRHFLDSRKTKSRVIALINDAKKHFIPTVKVKPRYRGDVL